MRTDRLLAEEIRPRRTLASTMWVGTGPRRGRIVARTRGGGWRRADLVLGHPVVLDVQPVSNRIEVRVWAAVDVPDDVADPALSAARSWAGFDDDLTGFAELVGSSPLLSRALRVVGAPVLGALPRAAESFGRAVLGQLVQGLEAQRSESQMVAMTGIPVEPDIWAYPTSEVLGATPAHVLRRCGISLRGATCLHGFATNEAAYQQLARDRRWHDLDRALTRLPGVGGWTSAETRLWLGDPDAVSVGDYHIPATVGWALGERSEDDASMLTLLAPYAGQRGRVIRLVERAARQGLVETKPRRGPRHALSAHRYH